MNTGVKMDGLLGTLTTHLGALGGEDGSTTLGKPDVKADPKFAAHLAEAAVKVDANVAAIGVAVTAKPDASPANALPAKGKAQTQTEKKKEKSSLASASDDDEKDDGEDAKVAPDAQLLALAQAMSAPQQLPSPVEASLTTKMHAALAEAMSATAAKTQTELAPLTAKSAQTSQASQKTASNAAPTTPAATAGSGKIDIKGMTAVTAAEAKALMQDARIALPTATASAAAAPAQTNAPAARVEMPAHAAVSGSSHAAVQAESAPVAQGQGEKREESGTGTGTSRDETAAPKHTATSTTKDKDADDAKASATDATAKDDTVTTAADFMTAPTVTAAAAANAPTNFVSTTANVKGMTAAASVTGTETAVKNAEAVGHKRVLASGDAQGALTVEDLGRFEVRAHSHDDGRVDVQVRAEHKEGAAALDAHASALRADVRVELPRATVQVQTNASGADTGSATRDRQRDAQTAGQRSDQSENRGAATTPSRVTATAPTNADAASTNRRNERVRIVL